VNGIGIDVILVGCIDVIVLILCISSFLLCCRALFKALVLKTVGVILGFFKISFRKQPISLNLSLNNVWTSQTE
jgi:hypothetical protein